MALLVHKEGDARRVSGNLIIERSSVDRKVLIETMIEDIKKIDLKRIESINQDDSNNSAITDNIRVPAFRLKKGSSIAQSSKILQVQKRRLRH